MKRQLFALVLALLLVVVLPCTAMAIDVPAQDMSEMYNAYTYILDGVQYQLPTQVSALMANGWKLLDTADNDATADSLDPMTYTIHTNLVKGDAKISVYTLNPTDAKLSIADCYVSRLVLETNSYSESEKAGAELFSLANGLKTGSTVSDFLDAYGYTLVYYDKAPRLQDYYEGYETDYWDDSYYLLKDGKFIQEAGDKDSPIESISFRYQLVSDDRAPVLNNNTSQLLQNELTLFFDGPMTNNDAAITEIQFELMAMPSPDAGNTSVPEEAPSTPEAQPDGSWTCENGHAGNTGNFCSECGAPRPAQKTACAECGYAFDGAVPNFCPNCGAAQQ